MEKYPVCAISAVVEAYRITSEMCGYETTLTSIVATVSSDVNLFYRMKQANGIGFFVYNPFRVVRLPTTQAQAMLNLTCHLNPPGDAHQETPKHRREEA